MYYLTRQPKEKKTTPVSRVPACSLCSDMMSVFAKGAAKNGGFRSLATASLTEECSSQRVSRDSRNCRKSQKRLKNRKAICCALLKRITKLKCVNSEFRSVSINPAKEVPSSGSMAPCWSHHGNHTRLEWIIIWSDRNWILKNANQSK